MDISLLIETCGVYQKVISKQCGKTDGNKTSKELKHIFTIMLGHVGISNLQARQRKLLLRPIDLEGNGG